jgi:hypothetical protein
MLRIENIEKLNDTHLSAWQVAEAKASGPKKWLPTEHYSISLGKGNSGAAILIDRCINRLTNQYHVYVCYDSFDNRIYEGAFSKRVIMDKGHFLKNMMGYVNAEYEMRKK